MSPKNFILYKTLLGDNSDKIRGVKGLGEKGLMKKFPELQNSSLTLKDIIQISESKFKEHVVYARIVQGVDELEKNYKVMDLSNPMIDERDKEYLKEVVNSKELNYIPDQFVAMYHQDQLGGMIRNVDFWVKDVFAKLVI
jgi:5'-3' exonuclease